jgi:murein L,D-transpeptidase YcbB/YkuD
MVSLKFIAMKASTKQKLNKATEWQNQLLVFIFISGLNILCVNGQCDENIIADNASYSEITTTLIKSNLQDCRSNVAWMEGIELQSVPLICSFYRKTNYNPVWTDGNKLTQQSEELLAMFRDSYKYGFEPSNFNIEELEQYSHQLIKEKQIKKSVELRARFEFIMTNSTFKFILYLKHGTHCLNTIDILINQDSAITGLPIYLSGLVSSSDLKGNILKLQSDDSSYIKLKDEMEMILSNLQLSENSPSNSYHKSDTIQYYNMFLYLYKRNSNLQNWINTAEPKDFKSLLLQFQKDAGIRISGKIDMATRNTIANICRARYTELARNLESFRNGSKPDENSFTLHHWQDLIWN